MSNSIAAAGKRKQAPAPDAAAENNGKKTMGRAKKVRGFPTVQRLAEGICQGEHFAQDAGGKLYHYADGAYRPRAEQLVKARVKALWLAWRLILRDEWSSRLANEVVEYIRVDAPELWERPPMDVLNLSNGLLRLSDRKLLPHSARHLSIVQLPVAFDPDATCPAIDQFVSEVFPADAINLAYEIPSWLARPDKSIQKAVLLNGEGANGKSVYLGLLLRFLGKVNTVAVSLHKLEADRFAVARLVGKLANICPDLPSEHLAGTSVFKALVGEDMLCGEYKFRDSFDVLPFARLVFSSNHLPRSGDSSPAFFRRWIVIPFERTFSREEQIPRDVLEARLSAPNELSGLLNKALAAMQRLKAQRGFSEPPSVLAAADEFRTMTDPLSVWLDTATVSEPNATVPCDALRMAYNAHAEQHGTPGLSKQNFGRAVRRMRPNIQDVQRTVAGRVKWCYLGIGLKGTDL